MHGPKSPELFEDLRHVQVSESRRYGADHVGQLVVHSVALGVRCRQLPGLFADQFVFLVHLRKVQDLKYYSNNSLAPH